MGEPTKPDYYKNSKGEDVIDIIKKFDLNFNLGNVLKYIVRAGKKDSATKAEDLAKATEYIRREHTHVLAENSKNI